MSHVTYRVSPGLTPDRHPFLFLPSPSPPPAACSKLALGVKLTLDQVLGFALWHAALAALSEPHRQACVALVTPRQPAAAAAAKQRRAGKAK